MMIPVTTPDNKTHFVNDQQIKIVRELTEKTQEIEFVDGAKLKVLTILQKQTAQVQRPSNIVVPIGPGKMGKA